MYNLAAIMCGCVGGWMCVCVHVRAGVCVYYFMFSSVFQVYFTLG